MFDFFKDIYLETHGIDSSRAMKENEEKKEKKFLFSRKTKAIIIIMAVIFILMQIFQIMALIEKGGIELLAATIFLCMMAMAIVILLFIRNKKTEIAAAVLVGVFIVLDYAYMTAFFS